MFFRLEKTDPGSSARAGIIHCGHGGIHTPVFMPVGTAGTVKGVHFSELHSDIGAEIILGNTYHLYLRPGTEILQSAGGLQSFTGWNGPLLTDSGGYQVYSLARIRKIREEGVTFQSHIDGSSHFFSPESVIGIQRKIGPDIMMAFDECTPYPCTKAYAKKSMERTLRWLGRCWEAFKESEAAYGYEQFLFPIVQGSVYDDLRKESAEKSAGFGLAGNAIGGLSVGEPAETLYAMTETVCGILPVDKPRYLMGVGTPANLLECVALGIDMFDCVLPTRNGRNGMLFTREGIINIRNKKWAHDLTPIDAQTDTRVSREHSRAYLRHLFASHEMLGAQIASIHNLAFYVQLMRDARAHILAGDFAAWKNKVIKNLDTRL